jgi:hypothetical protein
VPVIANSPGRVTSEGVLPQRAAIKRLRLPGFAKNITFKVKEEDKHPRHSNQRTTTLYQGTNP